MSDAFWFRDPRPWPCTPSCLTLYRVWPDGTAQATEDGEPYSWLSDDFALVRAPSPEEADRRVNGTAPGLPPEA